MEHIDICEEMTFLPAKKWWLHLHITRMGSRMWKFYLDSTKKNPIGHGWWPTKEEALAWAERN